MKVDLSVGDIQAIQTICDLALRASGTKGLQVVNHVLSKIATQVQLPLKEAPAKTSEEKTDP